MGSSYIWGFLGAYMALGKCGGVNILIRVGLPTGDHTVRTIPSLLICKNAAKRLRKGGDRGRPDGNNIRRPILMLEEYHPSMQVCKC